MQSNDFSQASLQAHRGRALAIDRLGIGGMAVGGSVVGAVLTAATFACMQFSAPSLASVNVAAATSSVAATRTVSNAALKGDRLPTAHSVSKLRGEGKTAVPAAAKGQTGSSIVSSESGEREIPVKPAEIGNAKRRLPLGCESAFGALVRSGNPAARCVTNLVPATRWAMADTMHQAVGM